MPRTATDERRSRGVSAERPLTRRARRKKPCVFCMDHNKTARHTDVDFLRRQLTDRGKIMSRRSTGCCARHQRALAVVIKRARHAGLLPFVIE